MTDLPAWLCPPPPPEKLGRWVRILSDAEREEQEKEKAEKHAKYAKQLERLKEANIKRHREKLEREGITVAAHQENLKRARAQRAKLRRARQRAAKTKAEQAPEKRKAEREAWWREFLG